MNSGRFTEIKIGKSFYYQLKVDSYLKPIHKNIQNNFLKFIPINNAAVAYKERTSYLDLFEPHQGGYHFLRLDIKSFFHNISERVISDCFSTYFEKSNISKDIKQELINAFVRLISYKIPDTSPNVKFAGKTVLPIGFATSPTISNIIFRKIDLMIQKLCLSKNVNYTRYADDMLFSASQSSSYLHSDSFMKEIEILLFTSGFKVNKHKTIKATHTISLNGYTIESKNPIKNEGVIRLSNKKTKLIESLIYKLNKNYSCRSIMESSFNFKINSKTFKFYPPTDSYVEKYCNSQILNKLTGFRSFFISILKYHEINQCMDVIALKKYTVIIEKLDKQINKVDKRIP
tara:strand:- start:288 stop:1322 length:1035 start_codon:yes stop_codon:yes gene_type:complete